MTEDQFNESLQYYTEDMRDDIRLRPLALELGYTVEYGKSFGDCIHFKKGNKTIWDCQRGWACADLINGYYKNHRYGPDLEAMLREEA